MYIQLSPQQQELLLELLDQANIKGSQATEFAQLKNAIKFPIKTPLPGICPPPIARPTPDDVYGYNKKPPTDNQPRP